MICQVHLSQRIPAKSILLSPSVMKEYGFTQQQSIQVEVGQSSVIASVHPVSWSGNQILLSPSIARSLSLPYTGSIRTTGETKKLKLGPVIGILTTGFSKDPTRPFGARSKLFRGFLQAGMEYKPYFYVFTPEMIDWQQKTVRAWYYRNQQWTLIRSPLPDVIYERIPNRKSESAQRVQFCVHQLKQVRQIPIFNQGFFNKWSIHQWLSEHSYTKNYIPETHQSPSLSVLNEMIKQYQMVYLKPSKGSLGLGIFRITSHPHQGYYCRFHHGNRNVLHYHRSLEKLITSYFGKGRRGFHHYLAQQGIRLIRFRERPVDFRIHMHKNQSNQWEIVGIGAKVAGSGSVTTHIRTGGSMLSTEELLRHVFAEKAPAIKNSLTKAAVEIAQVVEHYTDGPLGELGMDMGIDTHHQVWLFEVNAKPGRHIFEHPSLRKAGLYSAQSITSYSLALANFQ